MKLELSAECRNEVVDAQVAFIGNVCRICRIADKHGIDRDSLLAEASRDLLHMTSTITYKNYDPNTGMLDGSETDGE